jgi:hypothetical protein
MIIDTTDTFSLIAAWDKWSGNGYMRVWYPSVSISSASHMLGGSISASNLTDEEGVKIDGALATVAMISPHMLNVTVAFVRAEGSCLAVEKATGVNRKAVGPLANAGLEVCGEFIRKALSE